MDSGSSLRSPRNDGHWPTHRAAMSLSLRLRLPYPPGHKNKSSGGNDGRRSGSSSLAFSRPAWAGRVPDQAHHLVRAARHDRRLRHRRHRLCGAEPDQGMAHRAQGARPRAQRQQYRRAVRLADFRLDRRPLRPQDRADPLPTSCSASSPSSPPIRPISPNCPGCASIAGLGIGGVIPNLVAINAESAPRNLRATLAIIAVGLVPLGGALAGFAAAALVPQYGWQILFEIGGIVPVVFALAAIFGLPESIKFMTLHESHRGKMEALLAAIRPRFQGAAQRPLRHRGREAIAEQSRSICSATGWPRSRRSPG